MSPLRSHKAWSREEKLKLKNGARQGKPTGLIAWDLGRSKVAVYNEAHKLGISFHPTEKSPYNRPNADSAHEGNRVL
jgi:transposase